MERNLGTGVYIILNTANVKCYIGSAATSFYGRWHNHLSQLRRGVHGNNYLQRAWDKYGEVLFEFRVLEYCKPEDCVRREQYWMVLYMSHDKDFGYNLSPTAGSNLGVKNKEKRSPAAIAATADKNRGRKRTQETKDRISAALKGKRKSEQHKAALRSRKSEEHRAKLSKARLGKKLNLSDVDRARWSEIRRGRKLSEEARRKIGDAHRGKIVKQETKDKLRAANLGKTLSVETREKIAAANYKRWGKPQFTVVNIRWIRRAYKAGFMTQVELAELFDVSPPTIEKLLHT